MANHPALDNISLAIFDLDGTLVDSAPDLTEAANAMLVEFSLREVTLAAVRDWIGDGTHKLVERALANAGRPTCAPARSVDTEAAHAVFLQHYSAAPCRATRVYPGARQCLEALRARGLTRALVTNKPAALMAAVLEQLQLDAFFALELGGDSLARKKPHPAPLLHAARELGTQPRHTLMIGDSMQDVTAARRAGVRSLAVTYGYNGGRSIREAGADFYVDTLADLA